MNSVDIEYKTNSTSYVQILEHLEEVSNTFVPPLSTYVDLASYASKIKKHAVTFEAWHRDKLVSLVASYFNDPTFVKGYITNVSICREYQKKGIMKQNLRRALDYGLANGFEKVELNVRANNFNAIEFYKGLRFKEEQAADGTEFLKMSFTFSQTT